MFSVDRDERGEGGLSFFSNNGELIQSDTNKLKTSEMGGEARRVRKMERGGGEEEGREGGGRDSLIL